MSTAVAATKSMPRRTTSDEHCARARRGHQWLQEAPGNGESNMDGPVRESREDQGTLDNNSWSDARSPSFLPTADIARALHVPLEDLAYSQDAAE